MKTEPNLWHPHQWPVHGIPNKYILIATSRNHVQHSYISMKRFMGLKDIQLNLSAIHAAVSFLEAATPCFGQPIMQS